MPMPASVDIFGLTKMSTQVPKMCVEMAFPGGAHVFRVRASAYLLAFLVGACHDTIMLLSATCGRKHTNKFPGPEHVSRHIVSKRCNSKGSAYVRVGKCLERNQEDCVGRK